jgi:hemoglobin-like flavoprotein
MAMPMTQLFYGRLFQIEPGLRAMFHGPVEVQSNKFAAMLGTLVEGLADLERHRPALRAMGLRHSGYGVTPQHYPIVAQALLWAVSQTLEAEATPEVCAAWAAMVGDVAAMMLRD